MLSDEELAILEHLRAAREGISGIKAGAADLDLGCASVSIFDAERAVHARAGRRDATNATQAAALARAVAGLTCAPGEKPEAAIVIGKTNVTITVPLTAPTEAPQPRVSDRLPSARVSP